MIVAEDLRRRLCSLCSERVSEGLKINPNNFKVMCNEYATTRGFKLGKESFQTVRQYEYLRQIISTDRKYDMELTCRISIRWSAFGNNTDILNSKLPLFLHKLVLN